MSHEQSSLSYEELRTQIEQLKQQAQQADLNRLPYSSETKWALEDKEQKKQEEKPPK